MKLPVINYLLNKKTGKAIYDYKMIADNDKVLIGVSGQDSLALAGILNNWFLAPFVKLEELDT